ncbi:MAG: hypothetical protein Q4Q17_04095 [Tissierellia bacterium]|nr:hypothetical protein [Tissierellia bacterium]
MGRWSLKTDGKLIFFPMVLFLGISIFLLYKGIFYHAQVNARTEILKVSGDMHQFFHLIWGFFVAILATSMFEENYREKSISYIRTLPLRPNEIWTFRYGKLLFVTGVVVMVLLFVALGQINEGVLHFLERTQSEVAPFQLEFLPNFVSIMITLNFCLLLSQVLMMLLKNKIMTIAVFLAYGLMEYGPWGRFVGEYPLIFGTLRPLPVNMAVLPHQWIQLGLSVVLFLWIYLWHRKTYL